MSLLLYPQSCKWNKPILKGLTDLFFLIFLASFIPLAIIGAKRFYTVLVAILSKFCFVFILFYWLEISTGRLR